MRPHPHERLLQACKRGGLTRQGPLYVTLNAAGWSCGKALACSAEGPRVGIPAWEILLAKSQQPVNHMACDIKSEGAMYSSVEASKKTPPKGTDSILKWTHNLISSSSLINHESAL